MLDAGCGTGRELEWFANQGFAAEGFDSSIELVRLASDRVSAFANARVWQADFAILSLGRESYDGIWAHEVLNRLPPPGVQRVLQNFFMALKRGGILFVSIEIGEYGYGDFASLLRQSGFQLIAEGRPLAEAARRVGFIASRI